MPVYVQVQNDVKKNNEFDYILNVIDACIISVRQVFIYAAFF